MLLPLIAAVVCLFAFKVNQSAGSSQQKTIATKPFVLVVDAGHGGKDMGVIANGLHEKDISLKIAREIKALAPTYGIDVVLTRNSDAYMPPPQRIDFANAQHADAFVSVHVNAAERSEQVQSGFEVVVSSQSTQESPSVLFGSAMLQSLQPDFKIAPALQQKTVGIWVLDKSVIPATLIECGYLTNNNDATLLQDDAKIESIARAILNGTALYANNKNAISVQTIIKSRTDTTHPAQNMSSALYIVDGKINTKKEVDKIDPSSIQQINVLKGKEAADKYGDKGKDGVVEITLKKN